MAVWVVRAGSRGGQEQVAIDKNVATIHWNELPDLSGVTTRDALADLYRQRNTDASPNKAAIDVGQVWAFRERMKEGDLAVLPLHTRSAIAIGRIIGPYKYRTDLGSEVLHTRPVEWIRKDIPRTTFDQDILNSFGALMTVCQITRNNAEERIMAVLSGKEIPSQGMAATDQAGGGSDIAQSNNGYTSATIAFLKELPKRTSDTEWHKNNKIRYNHVLRDPTRNLIRQIREKYITRLSQDVADCPRQLSVLKKNDYGKGGYYGHYWFALMIRVLAPKRTLLNSSSYCMAQVNCAAMASRWATTLGNTSNACDTLFTIILLPLQITSRQPQVVRRLRSRSTVMLIVGRLATGPTC